MRRERQRIDVLAAMAVINPASAAELTAELHAGDLERAMAESAARGRTPSQPVPAGDRVAVELAGGRGRSRLALGTAALAAAAIAALAVFGGWFGGSGSGRPEFAAAAVRVAEANPRLLVTAPGWEIVRADEFEPDEGEVLFSGGRGRSLAVHWYPARMYGSYLRDRATVSRPERGTLLGQRATTVAYSPEEFATMLSPQGSVFLELRGRVGDRAAYDEILRSLRPVGVDAWLGAMPPSTVRPDVRSKVVEGMLRGIPLPPGFDAAELEGEGSISNHGSLAVKVGNAVA